jgi:hypothetical protein
VPAHIRRGATRAAMLLLLAVTATPLIAHAQAASRVWSTYVGHSGDDRVTGIAQAPISGRTVAVGVTNSRDFPPKMGTGSDSTNDAFVAVFALTGYPIRVPYFLFGGTGDDIINAVALGDGEQIYVVGKTQTANMPGFSIPSGTVRGLDAAFLARLTKDGTPEWLMYLDGLGSETATGVAVSGMDIYVTGSTDNCRFMSYTGSCAGGSEGFVVKVRDNNTGAPTVAWDRLLLGSLDDSITRPLVVGSNVLVVGTTSSPSFINVPAMRSLYGGGLSDALAAGFSADTGAVNWVAYLGGSLEDHGAGIVAGANGKIVVVGTIGTSSRGGNVFATRMDSEGMLEGSEERGGAEDEVVSSAVADTSGNIYIGGKTRSTDFPAPRAFDSTTELSLPPHEGFVMVLPAEGGEGWASFVGGDAIDDVLALSIQGIRLVMAGETSSSVELVTPSTYDGELSMLMDGFVLAVDAADITPPVRGTVNDRPRDDNDPVDISTQTSLDSISANWTGFSDGETGIFGYEWAIGTRPGADDVSPFTRTSNSLQSSFTKTGLTLIQGLTYYTTVRATNGSGLTVTASSNGVRVGPVVTDGGTNGGTDGGTDGGSGEEPEEGKAPLMGWSCTAADAGLPVLLGLLALMLLAGRRGSQPR